MDWRIGRNEEVGIRSEELGIMSDNILLDKSKAFALRIIKMYKYLTEEKKEYIYFLNKFFVLELALVLMQEKLLEVNLRLIFMQSYTSL